MERSTCWVDGEKTAKPLTMLCATTRPLASSHARLQCLVPSPTMAVLPYTVSAKNNTNPESICKHPSRLSQTWSCRLLHAHQLCITYIECTDIFSITYAVNMYTSTCTVGVALCLTVTVDFIIMPQLLLSVRKQSIDFFSETRKYIKHYLPHK